MPIGDPRDGFFYPNLTLMIDSYILCHNFEGKHSRERTHGLQCMTRFYSGGYRGDSCGSLEPPFETKYYSIFMRNFQKNQHKISNNQVQFSNRTPLCKFEPSIKKSWFRPCFYYLFYFIFMDQPIWESYGTRLHSPYGSHMGAHMGPI